MNRYTRYITVAGRTIITRIIEDIVPSPRTKGRGRKPKINPTRPDVAKINKKNQERKLTAILNSNFHPGDLWVRLSYPDVLDLDAAMKAVSKFKRKLREHARKNELPYKLIECIGQSESGKLHHHLVINQEIPEDVIRECWPEEYINIRPLWKEANRGNYQRVAAYILKNALETKDKRGKHKRAWRPSKGLVTPETVKRIMTGEPELDPECLKTFKGYIVDTNSISAYDDTRRNVRCVEYIQCSIDPNPPVKRSTRFGSIVRETPWYEEDEQLELDMYDQDWRVTNERLSAACK